MIAHAVNQLNAVTETLSAIQQEMLALASPLPEFPVVMEMFGVGEFPGPQLIAEIGDIRRFERKQSFQVLMLLRANLAHFSQKTTYIQNEGLDSLPGHVNASTTRSYRRSRFPVP